MLRGFFALPLAIGLAIVSPLLAQDMGSPKSIAELGKELGSPRYQERHRAAQALLKRSLAELAPLRALANDSPSSEVRTQLRRIFDAVEHRELMQAFEKLAAGKSDDRIDIEEGLWLVTLLSDPQPSREEMKKELDALAALVRRRLPDDLPLAKQDPRKVMETLHAVLYGERKFRINFADYNHPANCSALETLRKNQGLPITLGLVAVGVGRRLGLPIDGVATPGRYLVKYRVKADKPYSPDDIFLDPLGEGKVATAKEVIADFSDGNQVPFDAPKYLATAGHRESVRRMLANLVSAFSRQGDDRRAARVEAYMNIVGEEQEEDIIEPAP